MLNFTSSRVDCSPFGNNVPLWVPERCAMIDDFTRATIALWQAPHVCSTTRRSLGLAHMPVWAFPASCAVASPRWHRVQVSAFFGCASSIPRWHVVQLVAGAPIATPAIELMRSVGAFARTAGLGSEDEIVVGGTATKFNTAVFVNDSRRKRPALPAPLKKKPPEPPKNPPMRSPPFTSIVPFPPTVLATSLTAPPLPLPPNPADGLGPVAPLPPRARIVPDNVMVVDDAMSNAPPPPPPPKPVAPNAAPPPPPPDPPLIGNSPAVP